MFPNKNLKQFKNFRSFLLKPVLVYVSDNAEALCNILKYNGTYVAEYILTL